MAIEDHWGRADYVAQLLRPASGLYGALVKCRRFGYEKNLLSSSKLPVPVIVVGNITAGGTGKTPLVHWIAAFLRKHGYRPGVVIRGYRGTSPVWPILLDKNSRPQEAGDEAVLLAANDVIVAAGPDRVAAGSLLIKEKNCDIIISDDGLQHYALSRDLEIAVVDSDRKFGNGYLLPAGPLREPVSRLERVTMVVHNGASKGADNIMSCHISNARNLGSKDTVQPLSEWTGKQVHAVAGIGNPSRFFAGLSKLGIRLITHEYPDHHPFIGPDIEFNDTLPVLMTEKDAVKCREFANTRHWYVPLRVTMEESFGATLLEHISASCVHHGS